MSIVACSNCGAKNRIDEQAAAKLQPKCGRCGTLLNASNHASGASSAMGGKPIIVNDASFQRAVLAVRNQPVLLDCWAEWCGPCRLIAPVLEQLAAESNGKYLIEVTDLSGKSILAKSVNVGIAGQVETVNAPGLAVGMYLVKVSSADKQNSFTEKIVIN